MHDPKFNAASLLAIAFVMWALSLLLWWVAINTHRGISIPVILTIFAICVTGMYLNETK